MVEQGAGGAGDNDRIDQIVSGLKSLMEETNAPAGEAFAEFQVVQQQLDDALEDLARQAPGASARVGAAQKALDEAGETVKARTDEAKSRIAVLTEAVVFVDERAKQARPGQTLDLRSELQDHAERNGGVRLLLDRLAEQDPWWREAPK